MHSMFRAYRHALYIRLYIYTFIRLVKYNIILNGKMADAYEDVVGGALKLKGVADGGVKK